MGGRIKAKGTERNPPRYTRPRDMTGQYEKRARALADRLGFYRSEVWNLFQQLAAMREFEGLEYSREAHEAMAYEDLEAIYCKAEGDQLPC